MAENKALSKKKKKNSASFASPQRCASILECSLRLLHSRLYFIPRAFPSPPLAAAGTVHSFPWHHAAHVTLLAAPSEHTVEFTRPLPSTLIRRAEFSQSLLLPPKRHAWSWSTHLNSHLCLHPTTRSLSCAARATDPPLRRHRLAMDTKILTAQENFTFNHLRRI
jgi:hypothetical protein